MDNKNDFDLDFFDDEETESKEVSFEEFEKEAPSDNQSENTQSPTRTSAANRISIS